MVGSLRKALIVGWVWGLMLLLPITAQAAGEPVVRLDMDNLNLQMGVSSNLVLTLENAQEAEIIGIEGITHFDIHSQNQGSSTHIAGGNTTYVEYLYLTVMPKTVGQFTLKAFIRYEGAVYESNALEVSVFEDAVASDAAAKDLYVDTKLSHTTSYVGEKVTLTYVLYARNNISQYGFIDYAAPEGMMARDMPENQLIAEYVYVDGVKYAKYEIKQLILDPINAGEYTLPAYNLQVNVLRDGEAGGVFSGFPSGFFNYSEAVYLQTEPVTLTVKPLPAEGKPVHFSGIVGTPQITSQYSRDQVDYGDSLTLQVSIFGNCNLDGQKGIITEKIPGFTVYETQKDTVESVENGQYQVQKEFEAILVPEQTGVLTIDPIRIAYFNPETSQYENIDIPGAAITVLGEMPSFDGGQTTAPETVSITQVNYANPRDGYVTLHLNKQWLIGAAIGIAILLPLTAAVLWLVVHGKKQDPVIKDLYKRLLRSKDVYEMYDLFNAMIKRRYQLSLKANPQSVIQNSLPDTDTAAQITGIMEYMESQTEKDGAYIKNQIKNVCRQW